MSGRSGWGGHDPLVNEDQNCAIPCLDCTILPPEADPCPSCGGSGTQIEAAHMCNESIQMRYGEKSRSEYLDFKKALTSEPGDADLLGRFRQWIRGALADSMIHPAWCFGFDSVHFSSDREEFERLRTKVHGSLKQDFEESGRLLER